MDVVMFVSARGDVVLAQPLRHGCNVRVLSNTFRDELIARKRTDQSPVNTIGGVCFVHLKLTNMFLVMVASSHTSFFACTQYGVRLLQLLHAYYGAITEAVLLDNFAAVLAMMDESADFGFPSITDVAAMRSLVPADGIRGRVHRGAEEAERVSEVVMGSTPWRRRDLVYHVNEVFVDVVEELNMLLAVQPEAVLHSEVVGRVVMKSFLSGMPQCEMVFDATLPDSKDDIAGDDDDADAASYADSHRQHNHDDSSHDERVAHASGTTAAAHASSTLMLEDVRLHPCIALAHSARVRRSIHFTPPDDDFTVMQYRAKVHVPPPLTIAAASVRVVSSTRTSMAFSLVCGAAATGECVRDVVVRVPCPDNTASVQVKVDKGTATFSPREHAVVWTLSCLTAGAVVPFAADVRQIAPTDDDHATLWLQPPLRMSFACAAHSFSGFRIAQLKVHEATLLYTPNKWVRYATVAGEYQCRL